jgi:hypothetical protein
VESAAKSIFLVGNPTSNDRQNFRSENLLQFRNGDLPLQRWTEPSDRSSGDECRQNAVRTAVDSGSLDAKSTKENRIRLQEMPDPA